MTAVGIVKASAANLKKHESIIARGLGTFIEVGIALVAIRDNAEYEAAGFRSFDEYCCERWDFDANRARQFIRAAETVAAMETYAGTLVLSPATETQVRALAPLRKEPAVAVEVWEKAVEAAAGMQPTAKMIYQARSKMLHPSSQPAPAPAQGALDYAEAEPTEAQAAFFAPLMEPATVRHPARFSDEIMPVLAEALAGYVEVLDPFAGTGRIHELDGYGHRTTGVELEPEWAEMDGRTQVGNALALTFDDGAFDAICTSPTYGNRMADHHEAKDGSVRHSYTHDLGRPLSAGNSGAMQWGDEYRQFHMIAWAEALRVLRPGGRFVLNMSDHIRSGVRQHVTAWHIAALYRTDPSLVLSDIVPVHTARLRFGLNNGARTEVEYVLVFDKAAP